MITFFWTSFKLLFSYLKWMFFQPSGWKQYEKEQREQVVKKNRFIPEQIAQFKHLIFASYIILPSLLLVIGGIIVFTLQGNQGSQEDINNLAFILSASLAFALGIGLSFWIIGLDTAVGTGLIVLFYMAGGFVFYNQAYNTTTLPILALASGIASSVLNTLSENNKTTFNISLFIYQLSTIFLGITISFCILILTALVLFNLSRVSFQSLFVLPVLISFLLLSKKEHRKFIIYITITLTLYAICHYDYLSPSQDGHIFEGIAKGSLNGFVIFTSFFCLPYLVIARFFQSIRIATSVGTIIGAFSIAFLYPLLTQLDTKPIDGINGAKLFVEFQNNNTLLLLFISVACVSIGLFINLWLPILLTPFLIMWNTLNYLLDVKASRTTSLSAKRLKRHFAFWYEHYYLNIGGFGLIEHFDLLHEHNKTQCNNEIEFNEALTLLEQKTASSTVWKGTIEIIKIRADARVLGEVTDITSIQTLSTKTKRLHNSIFFAHFQDWSKSVTDALSYTQSYDQIQGLDQVRQRIQTFLQTNQNKSVQEYLNPIAQKWLTLLQTEIEKLHNQAQQVREIYSPYIVGSPVPHNNPVFVGRTEFIQQIEQRFKDGNSIFLYGQYRIGKTSLLKALRAFMPNMIVLYVDLQGVIPVCNNMDDFWRGLAKQLKHSAKNTYDLVLLEYLPTHGNAYEYFSEWVEQIGERIGEKILVIAFDEFARLHQAIKNGEAQLTASIVDILRHWIQHYPKRRLIIAAQNLEEFRSYHSVANAFQFEYLSYLSDEASHQLIERPVKDFPLQYDADAVQMMLDVTHNQPALLQLLCRQIVELKNIGIRTSSQPRHIFYQVTTVDVQHAIATSLKKGAGIFTTFEVRAREQGVVILRFIAQQGSQRVITKAEIEGFCKNSGDILKRLEQLELLKKVGHGYRFEVEMMRLWFEKEQHFS
ncbi:putative ATPase (AAA+ superfamily) [Beggiatoa alba B18LD]|uniref:Putative ATPase (AAA+ superfamily) n=1 Tax=Beggiatoa alba B18LD TaxID=395493 RepID=I3CJ67_9GAMM|nr:ATP-binding protein [Beggiatoa alba]EIJ43660.1 putative ATPase (AAA+ superfamily) [Beggiatoa alba B18LD]